MKGLLRRLLRRETPVEAPQPVDPMRELEDEMDALVRHHEDLYHPGFLCASNEEGQCVDRYGGIRAAGWLGQYTRRTW